MTRIAIAADHAGYGLKVAIRAYLEQQGVGIIDFGTHSEEPVDYPDFIRPAAMSVATGQCDLGIVMGGSGNGESMAANKIAGVRCAVCWNEASARLAREHNDANIIAIGARMVSVGEALNITDAWLQAAFAAGRHVRRIAKLESCRSRPIRHHEPSQGGTAMKQEIINNRLTVFVEDARLIPEAELEAIPNGKRTSVSGKNGIWIEVACPEGACSLEKDKITLPAGGVTPSETKGIWLSLFCPENRCQFYQNTDAP